MTKNKKIHRTKQIDMSSQAIDLRIRELAQLYKLGMAIQEAHFLGKYKDLPLQNNKITSKQKANLP